MIKNHICDAKKSVITNNHICNAKDSVTDKEAIHGQKRSSRGVLGENYFENMLQMYRRTPIPRIYQANVWLNLIFIKPLQTGTPSWWHCIFQHYLAVFLILFFWKLASITYRFKWVLVYISKLKNIYRINFIRRTLSFNENLTYLYLLAVQLV